MTLSNYQNNSIIFINSSSSNSFLTVEWISVLEGKKCNPVFIPMNKLKFGGNSSLSTELAAN